MHIQERSVHRERAVHQEKGVQTNPTEPRRIMDLRPHIPHITRRHSPLQETDICRTTPIYLSTSGIPLSVVHIPERLLVHHRSGPPSPTSFRQPSDTFPTPFRHTSYIPPKWYRISGGPIILSQPPPAGLFVRFLPCRSSSSPTVHRSCHL